ncbi:MAG TPA: 2-oxoacid:acceptor oxidoreductase family protein [bacterium]|nr:2-oxoacid:acceptor oxidoreductase family protein [bacterium]HOL34579.1 2-oxoacid:acceptor oxidoreductase family protein [bacterium]HPP07622.1 2-oxoacid:acceptor oxidoreductase family protein [bacterium]
MKNQNGRCWKIILGGSGGQGIVTMSRVLAYAGVIKKLNVSFLPAYGAEMRGGYVYSMLSLSTRELVSPVISQADYGIFLNENSMRLLSQYLKENAWILWNSSLIKPAKYNKNRDIGIPASEIAEKLGSVKIANMVMLGGLLKLLEKSSFPVIEKEVKTSIKHVMGENKKNLDLNLKAVSEGIKLVEEVMKNV